MSTPNPFVRDKTPATPAQVKADRLAALVVMQNNAGQRLLDELVATVTRQWSDLWENAQFTPAEVLSAWGTTAAERFRTAGIITAAIYQISPTLLDAKYLSAKHPYTAQPDGTVTLNS